MCDGGRPGNRESISQYAYCSSGSALPKIEIHVLASAISVQSSLAPSQHNGRPRLTLSRVLLRLLGKMLSHARCATFLPGGDRVWVCRIIAGPSHGFSGLKEDWLNCTRS